MSVVANNSNLNEKKKYANEKEDYLKCEMINDTNYD